MVWDLKLRLELDFHSGKPEHGRRALLPTLAGFSVGRNPFKVYWKIISMLQNTVQIFK